MGYAGPVSLWYNFPVEWFYTVLRGCIGIYVETVPVGAGAVLLLTKVPDFVEILQPFLNNIGISGLNHTHHISECSLWYF